MEISKQLGPVVLEFAIKEGAIMAEAKMPFMEMLDVAAAKLKGTIPGTWDDALIDGIMAALKAELLK